MVGDCGILHARGERERPDSRGDCLKWIQDGSPEDQGKAYSDPTIQGLIYALAMQALTSQTSPDAEKTSASPAPK
jgi:hypothetical protein